MKKFIVLIVLIFFAGTTGNLLAGDVLRKPKAAPNFNAGGAQLTQDEKNQIADKLTGGSEINTGDDKAPLDNKGKIFPKAQLDHKVSLGHKGEIVGKGKKGFLKGQKGFLKGEKGKPNEKVLDAKEPRKGFMKLNDPANKVGGAHHVPGAK